LLIVNNLLIFMPPFRDLSNTKGRTTKNASMMQHWIFYLRTTEKVKFGNEPGSPFPKFQHTGQQHKAIDFHLWHLASAAERVVEQSYHDPEGNVSIFLSF